MYYELKKKLPEIIEKATQKAAEAKQKERTRHKKFCEKHGIVYKEEEWEDDTPDNALE